MGGTRKVLKEANKIVKDFKKEVGTINTDLSVSSLVERMMVIQFEKLHIKKLEDIRYNLNKIIKKKKEYRRVNGTE